MRRLIFLICFILFNAAGADRILKKRGIPQDDEPKRGTTTVVSVDKPKDISKREVDPSDAPAGQQLPESDVSPAPPLPDTPAPAPVKPVVTKSPSSLKDTIKHFYAKTKGKNLDEEKDHKHHHHHHHHHYHSSDERKEELLAAINEEKNEQKQLESTGGGFNANINQNNNFSPSFGNVGNIGNRPSGNQPSVREISDLEESKIIIPEPEELESFRDKRKHHYSRFLDKYFNLLKHTLLQSGGKRHSAPEYFFDFRKIFFPNIFRENILDSLIDSPESSSSSSSSSESKAESDELFGRAMTSTTKKPNKKGKKKKEKKEEKKA